MPTTVGCHTHGEGTSLGGARHSFDPYGAGTSSGGAHQEFERGCRSDTAGFHYTPQQYYKENVVFHQRTDNTLQTLQEGQIHNDQRWEEQRQWNNTTSRTLTNIQEGQD
jgi:hypothetical protein